jgi:hypothetical protein
MKTTLSLMLLALMAFVVISCENSSELTEAEQNAAATIFRIDPAGVNIYSNEVVNLTIVGGNAPFRFAVSDTSMGTVTSTNTSTRVISYRPTSPLIGGANTIRIVDKNTWSANSVIVHIPTNDTSP